MHGVRIENSRCRLCRVVGAMEIVSDGERPACCLPLGHELARARKGAYRGCRRFVVRLCREARRYDSDNDCRRAVDAEAAGFAKEVDRFITASNELRHPKYAARNTRR